MLSNEKEILAKKIAEAELIHPNEISRTFCALPWMHLASKPDGRMQICCLSRDDLAETPEEGKKFGRPFRFGTDSIGEAFNTSRLKEVREKLLAGEQVSECTKCYQEEELGEHSMRIGFSQKWLSQEREPMRRRLLASMESEGQVDGDPWYLDLRQGNLCNLKCRSCSPDNSITIEREFNKIKAKNDWFRKTVWDREIEVDLNDWYEKDLFYSDMMKVLPGVKKFYFTGGEPTLIEKNYELMEECIARGYSSNIELMFNTNLTNIPDRFLLALSKFKSVMLNLSVDGYGAVQEYLRGNSKWANIDRNLRKLADMKLKNTHICLTPVVQAYNVLNITDLFDYVERLHLEYGRHVFYFMPIILDSPRFLDFDILPSPVKLLAAARIERYCERSKLLKKDQYMEKRLRQVIYKLKNENIVADPGAKSNFLAFTSALDEERGQQMDEFLPELTGELGGSWLAPQAT